MAAIPNQGYTFPTQLKQATSAPAQIGPMVGGNMTDFQNKYNSLPSLPVGSVGGINPVRPTPGITNGPTGVGNAPVSTVNLPHYINPAANAGGIVPAGNVYTPTGIGGATFPTSLKQGATSPTQTYRPTMAGTSPQTGGGFNPMSILNRTGSSFGNNTQPKRPAFGNAATGGATTGGSSTFNPNSLLDRLRTAATNRYR